MTDDLILKKTGISLRINGDPDNLLEFDPGDILFAEKYLQLIRNFDIKVEEFDKRSKELDSKIKNSTGGVPDNMEEKIELAKEACLFVRSEIDNVFGKNTSQNVFGDILSMTAFGNFFEAITPFIKKARSEKIAKYQNTPNGKKRVMK